MYQLKKKLLVSISVILLVIFISGQLLAFNEDKPSGCGSKTKEIEELISRNSSMKISGCETIGNTVGKIRSAIEKLRPKGGNVTILCANKACNITWTAYTTDFKQNNAVYSITFDDHGETQNNFVCHPLQP